MSATADLIIRVVADTKAAKKPLDESASRVDKVGAKMNKLAIPAAAAIAGIAAFGKAAVDSASRTQQAMGALDSVFGKNAGIVKKWSDTASTDVGVSKSQYGELATVIGAQLKNLGIPFDKVAGKTKTMIGLGADLAATFGGSTSDAVEALSATMRGETDPIERYGVSIKQATIDAEMAKEGTDKLTGAAAKQARTMATLTLISEQTASAHGQFARESDSAAGSAQIATAQMEDFKSTMGTALLPVVAAVTAALGKFAAFAQKNSTFVQILIGVLAALAVVILVVVAALKVYTIVTEIMAIASEHAWIAALGPIGLVILAVLAVVAVVVILWKKSETFRSIVIGVWTAIKVVATAVGRTLAKVWDKVASAGKKAFDFIKRNWKIMLIALTGPLGIMVALIIKNWGKIKDAAAKAWRAITTAFSNAMGTVRGIATNIASAIRNAFNGVKTAVTKAIHTAVEVFQTLPSKVKAAFSGASSLLYNIGRDIINGLVNGIEAAASGVASAVNKIISAIPKFIRKKMGIASPSKVMRKIGQDIIKGLSVGMADGLAGVRKVTQEAVDAITKTIGAATKNSKTAKRLSTLAIKSITDESNALEANAKKRDKVYAKIDKQTAILKEQRSAWDSLKSSVAGTAISFGSFAGAVGDTVSDMITDMTARVAKVQQFQKIMAALGRLRLNKQTLSELAQAGPEDALARATALLAGGATAVSQVNKLQSQLNTAANTLGGQTADAMYKAGIDANQALLDGLLANKANLEKTANKLARDLAAAVKKALKKYTPTGGNSGANATAPAVSGFAAPAVTSGVTAATPRHVVVNVSGAIDPESTARTIRRVLEGHDRRVGLRTA